MLKIWVIITWAAAGPYGNNDPNIGTPHITSWLNKDGSEAPNAFYSREACEEGLKGLWAQRSGRYIYAIRSECFSASIQTSNAS